MKYLVLLCIAGVWAVPAPKTSAPQCMVGNWGPWQPIQKYERVQHKSHPATVTKEWDTGRDNMQILREMKERRDENVVRKSAVELGLKGTKACSAEGFAGECSCENIDQMSFLTFDDMGYDPSFTQDEWQRGNDVWGWYDKMTGDEYALMGIAGGIAFIRITDPVNPKSLAVMYSHGTFSIYRDIKVIGNWAYVGSEAPDHGMQIFDLTRLRGMNTFVQDIKPDNHYAGIGNSHNIVANEETDTIFVVGANKGDYEHCDGGPHVVNVKDPMNPVFEGCFDADGYTHDAQCVIYRGPDARYFGREICFAFNEDSLTIVDVTDRKDMKALSKIIYDGVWYSHQGWLTDDQTVLLLDDEMDEYYGAEKNTKTYIWDVHDLENPILVRTHYHEHLCTDHNQYIKGKFSYQSNYDCGLKVMYIDQATMDLKEVGHFDVTPEGSTPGFMGSWSNYPYYPSGNIVVTSGDYGMFVVRPDYKALDAAAVAPPSGQSTETRFRQIVSSQAGAMCPALVENRVVPSK